MKAFCRILSVFLSISLLGTMICGCSKSNTNAIIYYEQVSVPTTLDPQLASSETELLIVRNIFEGLMRIDKDGAVVPGVATDYTYENREYTFHLNDAAAWSDGTSVTAFDFEFALKRAVDPNNKAPFRKKLLSVMNASLILNGSVSSEELGVSAMDSTTLVIRMQNDDREFLRTLATSVCMPCPKDFFTQCAGQYGLKKDRILSNGSYRLAKWDTENFAARLYRNDKYFGKFPSANAAVYLSYNTDSANIDKLKKSSVDIAYIANSETNAAVESNLLVAKNENIVWMMRISDAFSLNLRRSLITSVSHETFAADLSDGYNVAPSFFPAVLAGDDLDLEGMPVYNVKTAKGLFEDAIKKYDNKKLPTTTLYYYRDDAMAKPIGDIVAHWQSQLGAYINIQPTESISELTNLIAAKSNSIIIYPVRISDTDLSSYTSQFGYDFSDVSIVSADEIQKSIVADCKALPIAFENSVIAYSEHITSFNSTVGNGQTDFAYVTKE